MVFSFCREKKLKGLQRALTSAIQHLWDDSKCRRHVGPYRLTSAPIFSNVLVTEWEQIPAAKF